MLFVDFSSAFNTLSLMKIIRKLNTLSLRATLSQNITGHNTGAPQGCVLSPLPFTLYTHDCTTRYCEDSLVKNFFHDGNKNFIFKYPGILYYCITAQPYSADISPHQYHWCSVDGYRLVKKANSQYLTKTDRRQFDQRQI